MKNKQGKIILALACMITLGSSINAEAHSGRTDASGGHRDVNNVSGLGSYHYHCGGYPAHLHTNGICPYDSSAPIILDEPQKSLNENSWSGNNDILENEEERIEAENKAKEEKINREKEIITKKGYEDGNRSGYDKKENQAGKYTGPYKAEYIQGYNSGYSDGNVDIECEIIRAREKAIDDASKGEKEKKFFDKNILSEAYKIAYIQTEKENEEKLTKEFKQKGINDAVEEKDAENLDENINNKYKEVYLLAYNTKKEEIEKEEKILKLGIVGVIGVAGGGVYFYKKNKKSKNKLDI